MASSRFIGIVFKQYKLKLFVTYLLFCLEMLGSLLRPYFLGVAVNDIINGSYQGLILLSAVHLAWLIIGTARHMYDTRTFTNIYTTLVTGFLTNQNTIRDVSKLSAHSTLSRELVDFLESDFPYIIEAIYNLIGSAIILYFYNSHVVWICFAILVPVIVIGVSYGKKMSLLNRQKNDELEKQVSVIAVGNKTVIDRHFASLRKWQIKISDKEAINFGIIELMVLLMIASSLIISSHFFGSVILAGSLIGIYNYVLKFVSGLDTIPYAIQKMASLKDILNRIQRYNEPDVDKNKEDNRYVQGKLRLSA